MVVALPLFYFSMAQHFTHAVSHDHPFVLNPSAIIPSLVVTAWSYVQTVYERRHCNGEAELENKHCCSKQN